MIFLSNLMSTLQLGITCLFFIHRMAMVKKKLPNPVTAKTQRVPAAEVRAEHLTCDFAPVNLRRSAQKALPAERANLPVMHPGSPQTSCWGCETQFYPLHMCLFACERISHMSLKSQVLVSEVCSLDYTPKLVWKAVLCKDARRGSEIPNSFVPAQLSLQLPYAMCVSWLSASSGDS